MTYLFSDTSHEGVVHLPLFEIKFLPTVHDITQYDALVFTSKNGVNALCYHQLLWKEIPSYAIGQSTANHIEKCGGHVVFCSSSAYGDDFAYQLLPYLAQKRILFPRAKEISSSLPTILRNHNVFVDEYIAYETVCKEYPMEMKPPSHSKLIFTSPSTVTCFLKNFGWDDTYKAVAIGEKTASALPLESHKYVSHIQTIEACIELAKAI